MAMDVRSFFEQTLGGLFRSRPEAFREDASYTFHVTGPDGGRWTVDLRAATPTCLENGPAGDCTVEITTDDFGRVISDESLLLPLYYQDRIKVIGDLFKAAGIPQLLSRVASRGAPEFSLAALVAPTSAEAFLERTWPGEVMVVHGEPSRLPMLTEIPELADVHALLRAWPTAVSAFPSTSGDEYDAPEVRPETAEVLFAKGLALSFGRVERIIPRLTAYLRRLRVELGLPKSTNARCLAYASPKGAGAKPHFDQNVNFVVQLTGDKIWRIAANPVVKNPTLRHVMGAPSVPEALKVQATGDFPKEMPADALEVRMRPGSVLFMPAGHWHTTHAIESSLSLNFTFNQPCWADLVAIAIRDRLIARPPWRELAYGAGSDVDAKRHDAAVAHLDDLLAGLTDVLGRFEARDLIARAPSSEGAQGYFDLKRDWVKTLLPESKSGSS
jgi:50S ribosomal protein L16 3-hydroxylase